MTSAQRQSAAGLIPEDWVAQPVRAIATVKGGKRLPRGRTLQVAPTPHAYVRVTDMRPGGVDVSEIRYVPTDVFPAIKNYRIFLGDIFISVAGTLGIVGKIPPALDGANLTENADRITDIRCDRDYLLYSLTSDRIQRLIDSSRTVGAQPKLALGRIESFVIPLPPTDVEQRAIAAALADVDALLTKLDQLIAKKRDLKQAAMQQLLTGRTRLEGFAAPWQQIQMGRLGSFSKGRGLAKEDLARGGELAAVPYTAIYTDFGQIASMIDVAGRVSRSRAEVTVNRPSLLIASSSNMLENIGKAVALCIDDDVAVGGDVLIFRTQADVRFLSYLLSTEAHRRRVVALSQGSTIRHVYAATFSAYEVELPSREEQAAIADVLSDIDAELVALEARRNKTRQLKQGMMQSLLTGRIRLV